MSKTFFVAVGMIDAGFEFGGRDGIPIGKLYDALMGATMPDVELKSCPFCGAQAGGRDIADIIASMPEAKGHARFMIACNLCLIGQSGNTWDEAAEKWNTRANSFSKEAEDKDKSLGEGGEGTVAASVVIPEDSSVSAAHTFHLPDEFQHELSCARWVPYDENHKRYDKTVGCSCASKPVTCDQGITTVPDENSVPHQTDSEPDKTGLLHVAICQAVTLMNSELQTGGNSQAHTILRQALVDYADSVRVQPLGDHSEHEGEEAKKQELG